MENPYNKSTTIAFWTDEYITKNLLKAHLDPNKDVASRKLKTIKKTVDFIDGLLQEKKVICDYGCGPGLYTDLLSQKGHKVIGVDVSETSLDYAKKQNESVEYIEMNYLTDLLNEKIDFGMMIYCDFGAMDPVSQSVFLKNVYYTLKEDGAFFFDVMSYAWFDKQKEEYKRYKETDGFFIEGDAEVISKTIKYPNLKLVLRSYDIKGEFEMEYINRDKCYDVDEMRILLEDNGFQIVKVYSNTFGKKKTKASDTLAFLVEKIKQ